MTDKPALSLAGQTLRFKFNEGPTAGNTYEHKFNSDGTVVWRDVSGGGSKSPDTDAKGKSREDAEKKSGADASAKSGPQKPPPTKYASWEVAPGMHLVSYLSESGYTLTVLVNTKDRKLHGFASSSKEWYPLTGELQPTA
jgi:septal ring-binding cell division protein DamX